MSLNTCLRFIRCGEHGKTAHRMRTRWMKLISLLAVTICVQQTDCLAGDEWTMSSVGPWKGVGSMSVSQDENYMVFSQIQEDGRELAFEARCTNGSWSEATPITALNDFQMVGGLFMTDDCRRLYFHAHTDDANGYDLYASERENGVWGKPVKIADLSSSNDEMFPSVVEGSQEIYFLRHQATSDAKAEKKTSDKLSIYHAVAGKGGKWTRIQPINPAISFGYVQSARIMRDGETLLYSTRPEKRDKARPVFTRETIAEQWLLPEYMNEDDGMDFLCLQNAGANLYLIVPDNRKSNYGMIFKTKLPTPKYSNKAMATETGVVVNKQSGAPVSATIEVRNPTTNDLIGTYGTSPDDGSFHIVNDPDGSYMISVRGEGYSYFSKIVDYKGSPKPLMPTTIELFDTTTVGITLFDGDIYEPIDGHVTAVRQGDKVLFKGTRGRKGWLSLSLPVGYDYNIIASAKGFAKNSFMFKTGGDLVFDHVERELPMSPARRDMEIRIFDASSNEPISTTATFKSLDRNEEIELAPGKTSVSLRDGDTYVVNAHPQGYMFFNQKLNLKDDASTTFEIPLTALVTGANLELHDILFDTNQAFLRAESYAELDRLIRLMNENPDLKISLQAHTDNVGSQASNMKLSDRHAASVVQYLLENGIGGNRMKSKGFGASKPIAPNDTEEGRQRNRRVEILVIE